MRATARARLLSSLWALVIAAGLLYPAPPGPSSGLPEWMPTVAHLVLFLVLAWLLVPAQGEAPGRRRWAVACALAFAYGGLLEVAQIWIEGRGAEWLDVIMNGVGAVLGAAGATISASTVRQSSEYRADES